MLVDTRDPKRVAQILRENRERIANENGKDGTASDAATDTEADSSESEVELEPSRTIKSRVFHDKTTRVPTQPEGSMRVVATVRDTRGIEMLPPPPPDAHFDAIAKFRRARHDKEAERRRRARERSRERAEAAARRREEKRLAEVEKRAARTAAKEAKAAAKEAKAAAKERNAAKASSDSESERASDPEPATPRKKLPRLPGLSPPRRRRVRAPRRVGLRVRQVPPPRRRPPSIGRESAISAAPLFTPPPSSENLSTTRATRWTPRWDPSRKTS